MAKRDQARAGVSEAQSIIDAADRQVDPAVAAHEARHAAAAMLLDLEVTEARADNPSPEMGGYVVLGGIRSCVRVSRRS
jgi:hypothetical protein